MNTEQITHTNSEKLTLGQLRQDIKKHKKLYHKVFAATFIVGVFILLCIPNYYKCTVMLAPELSSNSKTGSLASIASSFGINIASGSYGTDALIPTLYPDLINSVAFRTSLFPVKVEMEDDSTHTQMTYYDYILNEQKRPWWSIAFKYAKEGILSIFLEEEDNSKVDPFKLTKEQFNVTKEIEKKVVCDVDLKTLVISINVTDQDPLIAATMADSVQLKLQRFITDYRTMKARADLEYNKKLLKEAEERYEKARLRYSSFSDSNRKTLFEGMRTEREKLENKLQIELRAYSQVAAQVQLAEAKVQEETPAFTTLQPATVPVKKQGPKRAILLLAVLFFSFVITSVVVFHKENHLILLLGGTYHSKIE